MPPAWSAVAATCQEIGEATDRGVDGQWLERPRKVHEGLLDHTRRCRIVGDRLHDMGRARAVERLGDRSRIEIEHAIGEVATLAGVAVMRLVGVKDQHLARPAGPQATAIVELLHAVEREPDPVGLVTVQVVGVAAEARLQPLQAGRRSVEADLVGVHARMFKTIGAACLIWAA